MSHYHDDVTYYMHYFSYYFPNIFPLVIYFYYVTIISIIFPITFDYVRDSHPNLQKLAGANSRPMR